MTNKIELKYIDNSLSLQLLKILQYKNFPNLFRYENQVKQQNVLSFTDNEADPTIVILVDIFRGQMNAFPLNAQALTNTAKSIDWSNGFLTKFKNNPNIKWDDIFDKVGPDNRIGLERHFKKTEKISFACISFEYEQLFIESLKGYFINMKPDSEVFDALTLKVDNLQEKISELKLNLDENVGPLKYEDAEIINSKWQYKSNESINFLRWSCSQTISAGYRINGELVSWIILYTDGSIGSLYTLEDHRGKGLSKKVVSYILIKFFENGFDHPYCFVRDNNISSQKVMRGFGFKPTSLVKWVFGSS
ncbi:hypothetical protein RB653_000874 [Dictyostelium firmibasis]|uniref:N-acetyltransferase domain-containing protein n=1 Tax=Dictyostelium firmibasis TaxID=79012 RepID=A0AAN7Z1I7_9MYCE